MTTPLEQSALDWLKYNKGNVGNLSLGRYSDDFTAAVKRMAGAATANQKLTINGLLNLSVSKTPASAAAAGTTGDICWDASYIYVCTATDTWKRAGIATW